MEKEKATSERAPLSVNQIAEQLGMFPSIVEAELMELQEAGAVKCYMHEGELYAVFQEGTDISAFEKSDVKSKTLSDESSPMYG